MSTWILERVVALVVVSPFLVIGVVALRFYWTNRGVRSRTPRDYVREVRKNSDATKPKARSLRPRQS